MIGALVLDLSINISFNPTAVFARRSYVATGGGCALHLTPFPAFYRLSQTLSGGPEPSLE
ncbi:MAG: hypothetical protein V4723_07905 [Pseudomonadota bacterium]